MFSFISTLFIIDSTKTQTRLASLTDDVILAAKDILEEILSEDVMCFYRQGHDIKHLIQALQREVRNSNIHFSFVKNHSCSSSEVEYKLEDITKLRHLFVHPNTSIDNKIFTSSHRH